MTRNLIRAGVDLIFLVLLIDGVRGRDKIQGDAQFLLVKLVDG